MLLQLIMVAIVIFFPQSVTFFLDKPSDVDPSKVKIEIQAPPSGGRRAAGLQVARRPELSARVRPTKKPRRSPAGLFLGVAAPVYRPWADIEKLKLSKVFSATRNHRFWSARKAFRLS